MLDNRNATQRNATQRNAPNSGDGDAAHSIAWRYGTDHFITSRHQSQETERALERCQQVLQSQMRSGRRGGWHGVALERLTNVARTSDRRRCFFGIGNGGSSRARCVGQELGHLCRRVVLLEGRVEQLSVGACYAHTYHARTHARVSLSPRNSWHQPQAERAVTYTDRADTRTTEPVRHGSRAHARPRGTQRVHQPTAHLRPRPGDREHSAVTAAHRTQPRREPPGARAREPRRV